MIYIIIIVLTCSKNENNIIILKVTNNDLIIILCYNIPTDNDRALLKSVGHRLPNNFFLYIETKKKMIYFCSAHFC